MKAKLFLLLLFIISIFLDAELIHIPIDYTSIQEGIDASSNNDTILVDIGIYFENINFNGKNVTLGSNFITTQDTSFISQTIIDGNLDGSVIVFDSNEDSTAVLSGFTIRNGSGTYYQGDIYKIGGGIYCLESSPTINNCYIRNNTIDDYWALGLGGGIGCFESTAILENLMIFDNYADCRGGGLYIGNLSGGSTVSNCSIYNNESPMGGGGISINSNSTLSYCKIFNNIATGDGESFYYGYGGGVYSSSDDSIFEYCEVSNNTAKRGSAICASNYSNTTYRSCTISDNNSIIEIGYSICLENFANLTLTNCIVWNNEFSTIYYDPYLEAVNLNVSYCDIEGGINSIQTNNNGSLNYAANNINENPLFVLPESFDYHLQNNSPCIDSGDPTLDIDPDGTITDIGAYYFHHYAEAIYPDFSSDSICGNPPLDVSFFDESLNFNTEIISWAWDFNSDGIIDSNEQNPEWIFEEIGLYSVSLSISDGIISETMTKENYIYVNNDSKIFISNSGSNETGDGSYENPFNTIQFGINWVAENDTIIILPGTYYETIDLLDKNLFLSSMYELTQDSMYIANTIIDGNADGSVISITGSQNSSTVLKGFTIKNGSGTFTNDLEIFYTHYGAGVYCVNSSPTFSNLIVMENQTEYSQGSGSGLLLSNSTSTIYCCRFLNNYAGTFGGGISIINNSEVEINNCDFLNNASEFYGGGIYTKDSDVSIFNSCFYSNQSEMGGGLLSEEQSSILIKNSTFEGNHSNGYGGGSHFYQSEFNIRNSLFSLNSGEKGGGLYAEESVNSIIDSTSFDNNNVTYSGGGIYCNDSNILINQVDFVENISTMNGGAIELFIGNEIEMSNCKIVDNESKDGAGISCGTSELSLYYCTLNGNSNGLDPNNGAGLSLSNSNVSVSNTIFYNNSANGAMGLGGAIKSTMGDLEILSSTIVDNSASIAGNGLFLDNTHCIMVNSLLWDNDEESIVFSPYNEPSFLIMDYNIYEGGVSCINTNDNGNVEWFENNLFQDPFFDTESLYFLLPYSPAIDAGTAFFVYEDEIIVDIEESEYFGIAPDIGYFEYGLTESNENQVSTPNNLLLNNYPNPFNPSTTISFNLSADQRVNVSIYNIKGQKIKTIINSKLEKGTHYIVWNGDDTNKKAISSGVYFINIKVEKGKSMVKKCLLLK